MMNHEDEIMRLVVELGEVCNNYRRDTVAQALVRLMAFTFFDRTGDKDRGADEMEQFVSQTAEAIRNTRFIKPPIH